MRRLLEERQIRQGPAQVLQGQVVHVNLGGRDLGMPQALDRATRSAPLRRARRAKVCRQAWGLIFLATMPALATARCPELRARVPNKALPALRIRPGSGAPRLRTGRCQGFVKSFFRRSKARFKAALGGGGLRRSSTKRI